MPSTIPPALRTQADAVGPFLSAVEKRFDDELRSDLACVGSLVKHVARFRGKMLRPMLVALCAAPSAN
ncbi:MAG: hypothetical protein QM770_24930 [Tepidisphaeraceae bacterium]